MRDISRIIVADTASLIALAITNIIPLLSQLFEKIIVPESVFNEATTDISKPGAQTIISSNKKQLFQIEQVNIADDFKILTNLLDAGEADAIYLAKKLSATVLIDEVRGRKVALNYGISVTGSAAILIKTKQLGLIKEVKPLLDKLKNHGYRMSDSLIIEILRIANENK